jgi:GxxExxY protein
MHPKFKEADLLSTEVIHSAIRVHRNKGPGLIESIYEWCLKIDLESKGHRVQSQKVIKIEYMGKTRDEPLRFDLLVNDCILVEGKSVTKIQPIHKAQLLSYMKLMDVPVGLLINFNELKLKDGLHRLILPNVNKM